MSHTAGEVAAECAALFREGHHEIVIYRAWRLAPLVLADLLIALTPDERRQALTRWPPGLAARAFQALPGELNPGRLLMALPSARAAALVERLPEPMATPLLASLSPAQRSTLLAALATPHRLTQGLDYPVATVGRLMTTAVVVVTDSDPIPLALEAVRRQARELGDRPVVHVVDVGRHLVGMLSFRELVVAPDGAHVRDVMLPLPRVIGARHSEAEGLDLLRREHLEHLPVVDPQGRLLGSLAGGQGGGLVAADQQLSFLQFAGVVGEETRRTGGIPALRSRGPMLQVSLVAGLLAALLLQRLVAAEHPLRALVPWVPLVAGLTGVAAIQAVASAQHRLAARRLPWTRRRAVLRRELLVGGVEGAFGGVLVGGLAWLVTRTWWVGASLAVTVFLLVPMVGLLAAAVPMVLRRCGVRPAYASMPALTAVADLLALLGLWGIGALIHALR